MIIIIIITGTPIVGFMHWSMLRFILLYFIYLCL